MVQSSYLMVLAVFSKFEGITSIELEDRGNLQMTGCIYGADRNMCYGMSASDSHRTTIQE